MKNKSLEQVMEKLAAAGDDLLEDHSLFLQTFGHRVFEIAESGDYPQFYMLVTAIKAIMEAGLDKAMQCAKGRPTNH